MGFYSTVAEPQKVRQKKLTCTQKTASREFFSYSIKSSQENRSQAPERHQGNRLTSIKIASGIPYWPGRDPIEENGGVNLYSMVANKVLNSLDYLGLAPAGSEWITEKINGESGFANFSSDKGHGWVKITITNNGGYPDAHATKQGSGSATSSKKDLSLSLSCDQESGDIKSNLGEGGNAGGASGSGATARATIENLKLDGKTASATFKAVATISPGAKITISGGVEGKGASLGMTYELPNDGASADLVRAASWKCVCKKKK